ncbi:MAG: adenylate/guanylate cyclase domain-containing protein [Pseudomonadota bacterium]
MTHAPLTLGIEDWLLGEALQDPDTQALFGALCQRLRGIGIPIERALMSWLILHPLFSSEEVFWRSDGRVGLEQYDHAMVGGQRWLESPLAHVHSNRLDTFRRRLTGDGALLDFPVLEDLAAEGMTDYFVNKAVFRVGDMPSVLGGETGIIVSWSTDRAGGFSPDDLTALERVLKPLAVATHASIQHRVLRNVATTFLGETAGRRLLTGEIKLGDGEMIPAVLWFSDLRGSTRLSDSMAPEDYLALLNIYYGCTASPIVEAGGEILTFIGDGVLAGFRVPDGNAAPAVALAEAAIGEARARQAAAVAAGTPGGAPLEFGIGLALGDVMMGNIGVPTRLAFSGIGTAVNRAQRIEAATKRFGTPVLAEQAVAALATGPWRAVGAAELDGLSERAELFAPEDTTLD